MQRRSTLAFLALLCVAFAVPACQRDRGVPPPAAATRTVYGTWATHDGAPVFRYDGPVTAPQRDAGGTATVPRHVFGNDAWSAEADARGRVRLFQRSGGPMWTGLASTSSGWGILDCGDPIEVRRDALAAPGTIEFAAAAVRYVDSVPGGGKVTQQLTFPAGPRFDVLRETTFVGVAADCRFTEVWDLTPEPLTLEPLLGPAAMTAAAVGRAAWNERYRYTWSLSGNALTLAIAIRPGAAAGEPDFGPYPPLWRLTWSGDATVALARGADDAARGAAVPVTAGPLEFAPPFAVLIERSGNAAASTTLHVEAAVPPPDGDAPEEVDAEFTGPAIPAWLSRELRWHAAQLPANANWDGHYGESFVDQGSAYLYMQGGSGAVRDLVINAVGLLASRPDLAAANLRTAMQWTAADGHTYYLGFGYGGLSDVAIRDESTDLDLFLAWGIAEYLTQTRDRGFLAQVVPFADGGTSTVADRLALAVDHLLNVTGRGDNGWIRVGSGDWSDGVLLFSPDFDLTRARGESFYNTAMALAVLPAAVAWLETYDSALADQARAFLDALRAAAGRGWRGEWFVRGSFGNGEYLGEDRPFLESNLWALRAELGTASQQQTLLAALQRELDADEPIGARNVYPPSEVAGAFLVPGWDVNGGVWAALQGLLPGAYAQADSAAAWASLLESTLQRHSEVYPDIWFGIWTGPDSYNAAYADQPGQTFVHLATPMASYPAANMNVHAGPLIALQQLVGLSGDPATLALRPRLPLASWRLRTALVDIGWTPQAIDLSFRGVAHADDAWAVTLPSSWGGRACAGPSPHAPVAVRDGAAVVPLAATARLVPCEP